MTLLAASDTAPVALLAVSLAEEVTLVKPSEALDFMVEAVVVVALRFCTWRKASRVGRITARVAAADMANVRN